MARDVYGLGRTLDDDADGTLWDLLGRMDGSQMSPRWTGSSRRATLTSARERSDER